MNGYDLTRKWYNYKFDNPDKVRAIHSDFYFYIVDLWNRLGQKEKIGLPTSITMQCLNIGSRNTYYKVIEDLAEFGFIKIISEAKNQHQSRIIALSKNEQATKQARKQALEQASIQASEQTTEHIIEQQTTNNKQLSKSHYGDKSPSQNSEEKKDDLLKNPKPEKEKKVAPKKENNHFTKMVEVWFDFYKSKFESEPSFDAIQGKHLKAILTKFQKLAKNKDLEESKEFDWNEDRAVRTFQKFLENAWVDNWLQHHFLLKNLMSNFDAIINKKPIENGKSNNSNGTKKQFVFSAQSIIDKTQTG